VLQRKKEKRSEMKQDLSPVEAPSGMRVIVRLFAQVSAKRRREPEAPI
jgi:hypothetical protein